MKSEPNMFTLNVKNYFLGYKQNIEILDYEKSCQVEYLAHVTLILVASQQQSLKSQFESLKITM